MKHLFRLRYSARKKGFTLVELIIVMAILGLLAAIILPIMMGMVTSSRVTSVNNTAADIKRNIENFFTDADANYREYAMLLDDTKPIAFTISVSQNKWSIDAVSDTSAFVHSEEWGVAASGKSAADPWLNTVSGEEKLAIFLANLLPEFSDGVIMATCGRARATAVWCTFDTSTVTDVNDYPAFGSGRTVAWVDGSGNERVSYPWDGSTAGINLDGYLVGTAPVLPIGND